MYLAQSKLIDVQGLQSRITEVDDPIALLRTALGQARQQLRDYHMQGAPSQDIVHHHAWLVDQVLHLAWTHHQHLVPQKIELALVAVGGYGRGELHPHSDVDLMLLVQTQRYEKIRLFTESLLSFLWDIGLEVGHSVRSIKDCVREAKNDLTVATNIMEARLLAGSEKLIEEMKNKTAAPKLWPADTFYKAKLEEQQVRHDKFDDTAYNLEPNIKEGPGGLRDIQTVLWVAQRQYGATQLRDLIEHGFLTTDEYRSLVRGRNFLWKLRNGLHFNSNRREDRLLFDHQRTLAEWMGYRDDDSRLAVEQLMKRYYRTVKELRLLNEILLQHYEEINLSSASARVEAINRRFRAYNGYLETVDEDIFEKSPLALLELFLILQQNPALKGVRAGTIRQVRANLHRIDQEFRNDIRCRSLFMEIMRQPRGQTHTLRRMNAYGVLGAYIPLFGAVVGQMQYDLFHVYTVDAHSLFVVRNLRRFAHPEHRGEFPRASRLMSQAFKPERLYLAGVFHDIAKGRKGDHSILGERDAFDFCKSHEMSNYDAHFVAWLVRNHLLMSWTAQRQDITDEGVVRDFAKKVGDQERLNNLYLLTIADIRGTSPHVWNAWKGRLLDDLYFITTQVLRRGHTEPTRVEQRIKDVKEQALEFIDKERIAPEVISQHWESFPNDYFLRYSASEIALHVNMIASTAAIQLPLVEVQHDPNLGANVFLVYAPETGRLLSLVTGGFARMNLNIVDARIHATPAGFALYTFIALEQGDRQTSDPETLQRLKHRLRNEIVNPALDRPRKQAHIPRTLKHFPIETRVSFTQSPSGQHTMMEVVAQDQPGLLHAVALCLSECKVKLATAKIATYGERAEDIFFITDRDGNLVTKHTQQTCLAHRIQQALSLDTEGHSPKTASL